MTNKNITLYKNFSSTDPFYLSVDEVLLRIKDSHIKKQIEALRSEENDKKRGLLKKQLPCILFSGKFSERKDKSMIEHSGFVILDFDHVENLRELKSEMMLHDFVYAAFISPSGDGLKVLVRIPAEKEKHRGYYRGLVKMFPNLDSTSKNESRICFESIDPDIYINKEATEFTEYVEDYQKATPLGDFKTAERNDYSQAQVALDMIRSSIDGEKHDVLIKASRLMGGFISGGQIQEDEAYRLLENEIQGKGVEDMEGALKDIKDGIEHGKANPLNKEEKPEVSKPKKSVKIEEDDCIATRKDMSADLKKWRNGTFELGLPTGLASLDKYFRFKKGNFNVFNGKDNVGKSTVLWWLMILSSVYHDWNWILLSIENRNSTVKKRLIEFYWSEPIEKMTDLKYKKASEFVDKHFSIVKNEKLYNYKDVLEIHGNLSKSKKIDGILIDPYNGLSIALSDSSKLSTHEYHYECATEMQLYAKLKECCIYANAHVITSAARESTAPGKADVEGGAKWANKTDDFVTIHRDVQDPVNWMNTELHVRKIKEIETGGSYTPFDQPYILKMVNGSGFQDEHGFNPILEYHKNKNYKNPTLTPNEDWLQEKRIEESVAQVKDPDAYTSSQDNIIGEDAPF